MPAADSNAASVTRAGEALGFAGVLSRAQVAGLWKTLPSLDGVRRLDLSDLQGVDSAGVALLAEVASRCEGDTVVVGGPESLAALRSAYRLDGTLGFAAS